MTTTIHDVVATWWWRALLLLTLRENTTCKDNNQQHYWENNIKDNGEEADWIWLIVNFRHMSGVDHCHRDGLVFGRAGEAFDVGCDVHASCMNVSCVVDARARCDASHNAPRNVASTARAEPNERTKAHSTSQNPCHHLVSGLPLPCHQTKSYNVFTSDKNSRQAPQGQTNSSVISLR